jgi:hypothetical protein
MASPNIEIRTSAASPKSPAKSAPTELPPALKDLLAKLPPRVSRRTLADLLTQNFFPISYRSLEAWHLPTQHLNGYATVSTEAGFLMAYAKVQAAPVIMGGRRETRHAA